MSGLWKTWMHVWCWATLAFGAVLAAVAVPALQGPALAFYDLVLWPFDGAPAAFDPIARFTRLARLHLRNAGLVSDRFRRLYWHGRAGQCGQQHGVSGNVPDPGFGQRRTRPWRRKDPHGLSEWSVIRPGGGRAARLRRSNRHGCQS
jgi:hypothetical protein